MCSKLNKRENKRKALPKKGIVVEIVAHIHSTCSFAAVAVYSNVRERVRTVCSVVAMKAMDPFNEERVLLCFRLIFFSSFFSLSLEYS